MIFRYARHTTNLNLIEKFYIEIVGLKKLGGFEGHDNYDGIFLGIPGESWHLEFTTSPDKPESRFDEDDALVFYANNETELTDIKKHLKRQDVRLETPKNPYWQENGIMIADPDGFKIIFSIKP
ncbi:MAG: VOC family protein [Pedobacter sp.]|nr:MAG: VOC family protein [Pedobacter sp.]